MANQVNAPDGVLIINKHAGVTSHDIVGMVRRSKQGNALGPHKVGQRRVTRIACGGLKALPRFLREARCIDLKQVKGHAEARSQLAAKFGVAVGFLAADAVMHVQCHHGGEVLYQREEHHRIRTARKGYGKRCALGQARKLTRIAKANGVCLLSHYSSSRVVSMVRNLV